MFGFSNRENSFCLHIWIHTPFLTHTHSDQLKYTQSSLHIHTLTNSNTDTFSYTYTLWLTKIHTAIPTHTHPYGRMQFTRGCLYTCVEHTLWLIQIHTIILTYTHFDQLNVQTQSSVHIHTESSLTYTHTAWYTKTHNTIFLHVLTNSEDCYPLKRLFHKRKRQSHLYILRQYSSTNIRLLHEK